MKEIANDQGKTLDLEREKRLDATRTLKNSETDLLKIGRASCRERVLVAV